MSTRLRWYTLLILDITALSSIVVVIAIRIIKSDFIAALSLAVALLSLILWRMIVFSATGRSYSEHGIENHDSWPFEMSDKEFVSGSGTFRSGDEI